MTLKTTLDALTQPFPRGFRGNSEIVSAKLGAMNSFLFLLKTRSESVPSSDVQTALSGVIDFVESNRTGECDKRRAINFYSRIVRYRPQDVTADSLERILAVIQEQAESGSNTLKWLGVRDGLRRDLRELRDLCNPLEHDGPGHTSFALTKSTTLPDLYMTILVDGIAGDGNDRWERQACLYPYIALLGANDPRITPDNLRRVDDVIEEGINTPTLNNSGQSEWIQLRRAFDAARAKYSEVRAETSLAESIGLRKDKTANAALVQG